jgi:phospholipase/carboxylesterase
MNPSLVIALHGLGANGEDLMPLQAMMSLDDVPWLFPDAPELTVTANAGMRMPAWFDIMGFSPNDPIDSLGIAQSADKIQQLIATQVALGVDASRILLLGFSQGGVVALHAALSGGVSVGAVIGLSTWLPASDALSPIESQLKTPIWLGHGQYDNLVPLAAHELAKVRLTDLGVTQVTSRCYPMAHSILPEELTDAMNWLRSVKV